MYVPEDKVKNQFLMAMCKMLFSNYGVEYHKWRIQSILRAQFSHPDGV